MRMVRKQIYIRKEHDQLLKRLAAQRGVSEAEVIRQALEQEMESKRDRPLPASQAAFEAFKREALARREFGVTDEPYKWNREELYEERLARFGPDRGDEA
jgi:hypothetical protein